MSKAALVVNEALSLVQSGQAHCEEDYTYGASNEYGL